MKTTLAILCALLVGAPLAAQVRGTPPPPPRRVTPPPPPLPKIALRPFFVATAESFNASQTMKAAFGRAVQPFFGGGLELALRNGLYVDVAASRFSRTGQRAFMANGQTFQLGLPLTATVTPVEVTGGYRYRMKQAPRVFPYVGAGIGSYAYTETSPSSDASENVDVRHVGYLAVGGVDVRVHRWIGIAGDVQYTHVPGILGTGGISKEAGENDLGGLAVRIKVTVGK
jgi:hypothetical protein